jgi:hypothetical protein
MIIYDKIKRYNPVTGEPTEKWVEKEIRCDFTGEVLDYDNYYCAYNLDYGNQDPCLGSSGEEYELGKALDIYMFPFLVQTYHFISDGSDSKDGIAEWRMMEEALKNCKKKDSEWYRCYTFDSICRHARVRTAYRLIRENIITPEQLKSDR